MLWREHHCKLMRQTCHFWIKNTFLYFTENIFISRRYMYKVWQSSTSNRTWIKKTLEKFRNHRDGNEKFWRLFKNSKINIYLRNIFWWHHHYKTGILIVILHCKQCTEVKYLFIFHWWRCVFYMLCLSGVEFQTYELFAWINIKNFFHACVSDLWSV